jgi:hypothetical protein
MSLPNPEYKNRLFVAITLKKYGVTKEKALDYFDRFCRWKDYNRESTDKYLCVVYNYNSAGRPFLTSPITNLPALPNSYELLKYFLDHTEPVYFSPPPVIRDAAIYYHSIGLHCIPSMKNEKRPLVKWKQYQDIQPSIELIKKWNWSGGLILLATDHHSFLDIDIKSEKHPNGLGFLDEKTISGRMFERTKNGGYHIFGKGKLESKSIGWAEIKGKGKYILTYPTEGYKL